jgi:methionyl-tRNA synthetase
MFEYLFSHPFILFILIVWTLIWKGIALWRTAREGKRRWFIVFMIINTFGLLEIFYLYALPRFLKPQPEPKAPSSL